MKKKEIENIATDEYNEKSWKLIIDVFWKRYNERYFKPINVLQENENFEIRNNCGFLIVTID